MESERMIEPSWWARTTRLLVVVVGGGGAWGLAGCSFVPTARLDECHRLSQTLQAENDRLKDTAISLRAQNQDLNQRAADDARRLRLQEEEVQRLVQSVSAYQAERDQLAAAFDRIKRQVRTAAAAGPASTADRRDP
jgi:chemotaxis protein MotB